MLRLIYSLREDLTMLTRSQLLHNIEKLLTSQGFKTSDIYDQGSFDIVARKDLQILLLKTFQNIDSINEQNAHEMKQLANIWKSKPSLSRKNMNLVR